MNARKTIYSYAIKFTDEPLRCEGKEYSQTARISLRDENKNLLEKRKYGVFDLEVLYETIHKGLDLDISNCLIHNFSIEDYKKRYHIDESIKITIHNINASNSFFEADKLVDFSNVVFEGKKTNFKNAHFGLGNLSFLNCKFNTPTTDFSNTSYSEGNNIFQYAEFADGLVSFENASFINGNLSFINARFNNGLTTFKNVDFGNGNVSFHFALFSKGNINFERTLFGGNLTDFSKVEFGSGKVDFRKANFGNSEVSFEDVMLQDNKLIFRRAKFGNSPISFKQSEMPNAQIILNEAEFGTGRISFFGVNANAIKIKSSILSSYVDFRVTRCEVIDISNAIIHNILDFKKGINQVKIDKLYIYSVRNLGKLFINWEENDIPKIIGQQTKTTYHQKAEQFRILKEDFHTMGQYEDEDKAYIEFKRNELKDIIHAAQKQSISKRVLAYIRFGFQTIVFDWMGKYATSPLRVLTSIFFVYGFYSVLYVLFELTNHGQISCIATEMGTWEKIIDSFYFSAVTFLTIGYGECVPTGFFKIIAPLEGWTGVFMMSYFTVAFVRKILR